MKDLISIIVPIYNVEQYLPRCIESLIKQTYSNIEILLLIDGSPDNSLDIANKYAKEDSRIRVFYKKNTGLADTRKFGFEQTKGKYIMFVDSDDWVEHDYCEYLYNLLKKYKTDLATCNYCINDDLEKLDEEIVVVNDSQIIDNYFTQNNIKTCVWNKIYKKSTLKKFDLFDKIDSNGEDVIFTCNVLSNIKSVVCSNIQKIHYNVTNTSITRSLVNLKKIENNYYAHKKQIEIVTSKYSSDYYKQHLAQEKLFDSLLSLYIQMVNETSKNEHESYLVNLIKENFKKYNKKLNISKTKKLKLFLISKCNWLIKYFYKLKNEKLLLLINLIVFLSIIVLIAFPITFTKYNQNKIDSMYRNMVNFINSPVKSTLDLTNNFGYEILNYTNIDNDIELVVFKNGYCATKISGNSKVNVFTTSKSNCSADNSPEVKYFSGYNIAINNIINPKIRNYIIYGESSNEKVIKNTKLVKENKEKYKPIEIKIKTENNIENFKINMIGHDSLQKINNQADYINYREQKIVRNIGKYTLTGKEEIKKIKSSSKKYNTFTINDELFDEKLYITLLKKEYKKSSDIYDAINDAKRNNKELNVYYVLEKSKIEYIKLPALELNYENDNITFDSDNQVTLLLYSHD